MVEEGELGGACLSEEGIRAPCSKGGDGGHAGCKSSDEIPGTPYDRITSEGMDIVSDKTGKVYKPMT